MIGDSSRYFDIREHSGLFDASHSFGRLLVSGRDAIDLLHRMSTNDLKPLEQAKGAALTFLTNEKGRIIDLLKVLRDHEGGIVLLTSPGKEAVVTQWLDKFTIMEDARFMQATEKIAQFLLCGPDSTSILQHYAAEDLSGESRNEMFALQFESVRATLVKAPSLAGKAWFILAPAENSGLIWKRLEHDATAHGGALLDSELFDLLRIENGTPLAPNELNEKHNPLETPVAGEAVSFTKGCYIGQEVIARLDAQDKVQRHLMGLRFEGGLPAVGDRIIDPAILVAPPLGSEIGEVTSTASSPEFGQIGLGYVRGKYANPGTKLSVKSSSGNIVDATLVSLPFHD